MIVVGTRPTADPFLVYQILLTEMPALATKSNVQRLVPPSLVQYLTTRRIFFPCVSIMASVVSRPPMPLILGMEFESTGKCMDQA